MSNNNPSAVTTQSAQQVSVSVNHPKLNEADPESIRIFLNLYDQYVNEIKARAMQIADSDVTTEAVRPVDLRFCVNIEYLKSTIALGLINDVESYDGLTNETLRHYLENEANESHKNVTLERLDSIIKKELRMNMRNNDAN